MDKKLIFLFRKRPLDLLMELRRNGESYSQKISMKIDCTYAHTTNIIKKLVELNIIDSKKIGRKKSLTLTNKGKEICEHLNEVIKKI